MEQTPLEWFANRLIERGLDYSIEDFEQAKEIEQAQRRKDFIAGNECACMCHENIDDYFNQYID
jgi:hypothetical protein